jgi:DNA invertase Pin-like site-specific DNA recombinase
MATAYSYIRFSTPGQKLGDSLRRQLERSMAYALEHGLTLDQSMRDEGLSGYHGEHRKSGALGQFIEKVKAGEIPHGSVLIVEAFDRLSRQAPREAQAQFLTLINSGVEVVTLIDGQRYSRETIDANLGQLFMSIGMMMGAHAESATKSVRTREAWKKRRTDATNIAPSWIRKENGKFAIDQEKADVVRQIFSDIQTMGLNKLAAKLNKDDTPALTKRSRERRQTVWDESGLLQLIRSRNVLGEQEMGRYVDNKRQMLGENQIGAYPAIITEAAWYAANQALDARKRGNGSALTGRNASKVTNLFGALARCAVCGERMIVTQKGRAGNFHYLGCSMAKIGKCSAKTYHRLDKVEPYFLRYLAAASLGEIPAVDNPVTEILSKITDARAEANRLEKSYERLFFQFADTAPDSLAVRNLAKLDEQHKAKLAEIKTLESRLAAAKTATPVAAQFSAMRELVAGLDGLPEEKRVQIRAKIANGLPGIVKAILFDADGSWSVKLVDVLPANLPMTSDGHLVRFMHQMEKYPEETADYFSRKDNKIIFHLDRVKFPVQR